MSDFQNAEDWKRRERALHATVSILVVLSFYGVEDYCIKREMATKKKKSNENLVSVITKLARDRSVGKRLAAACHPDRVPAELNDSSTELFRFFQTIRETDG